MHIANDGGTVRQAWLEGAELDESCRGMRFRLTVGKEGGVICDVVMTDRDLSREQVERLATHAVVNTDPLENPLPIVDDDGAPVRIVTDAVHVQPVSRIIRLGPDAKEEPPREVRVVNPLAAMAIISGTMATFGGLDWLGIPMALTGTFLLVRRAKVQPGLTHTYNVAVARERERRERMPDMATPCR